MPEQIHSETIEAAVRAPYTRIIRRDREDGTFVASILELPGVLAGGETLEEVNESLDEGIRVWVEHELGVGHSIPEPFEPDRFSGRVTLRMTPTLHERAQLRADLEGVSLNRLLEVAIATYLGDRSTDLQRRAAAAGTRRTSQTGARSRAASRTPSDKTGHVRTAPDAVSSRGQFVRKETTKRFTGVWKV